MTRANRSHEWVGATEIRLRPDDAASASASERFRIAAMVTVTILDVYCGVCRRSYSEELAAAACKPGMVVRGGPRTEDPP